MQGHRDIPPLELLLLELRVLDDFRSLCCMKEFGDGFDDVTFSTLMHIVAETEIVSFHTLPVAFPLLTISKNSLYTLFCSLIFHHGVLLKISIPVPKFFFVHLARHFILPLFQVHLSFDESPSHRIPMS